MHRNRRKTSGDPGFNSDIYATAGQTIIHQKHTVLDAQMSVGQLRDRLQSQLAGKSVFAVDMTEAERLLIAAEPDLDPTKLAETVERLYRQDPTWSRGQLRDRLTSRLSDRLARMRRALGYYEHVLGRVVTDSVNAIAKVLTGIPEREAFKQFTENANLPIFYGYQAVPLPQGFHVPTYQEVLNDVVSRYQSPEMQALLKFWKGEELQSYQKIQDDFQRHVNAVFAKSIANRDAIYTRMYELQDQRIWEQLKQAGQPGEKIRTQLGDVLTPMTRNSLTRIRDHAAKALDSAVQRGADASIILHFEKQQLAAEGLLALIPVGQDTPIISDNPLAIEWRTYIQRTTTDPILQREQFPIISVDNLLLEAAIIAKAAYAQSAMVYPWAPAGICDDREPVDKHTGAGSTVIGVGVRPACVSGPTRTLGSLG